MKSRITQYGSLVLLMLLSQIPTLGHAHGVNGTMEKGGGICITAQYDTDEAMSYARVTIRSPGGGLDFQTGRTDRNGRFCFFPDEDGEWEVVVDDGMGHRLKVDVPFYENSPATGLTPARQKQGSSLSRLQKSVMGLCIIFGILGWLLWGRSKKHHSQAIQQQNPE